MGMGRRVLRTIVAQGQTIAETLEIAQDGAQKLIESYREHGDPLPPALRKTVGGNRRARWLVSPQPQAARPSSTSR